MKSRVTLSFAFATLLATSATGVGCAASNAPRPPNPECAVVPAASSTAPVAVPAASTAAAAPAASSPPAAPKANLDAPATFDVAAVDDWIARQIEAKGFVGLSVAIVKDGAVVLDKGYGQSQLGPDVAAAPETAFSIGSITKQFVASIVLQLADQKKLSLDDKVAKYFPDLTRARDITLYDLMTHVSGYRDNYPLDFVDQEMKQPATTDDIIARYAKRPLDFEPRTRFSYSSTGYKILGRVVEKVTGRPLGAVLEDRILRPLGMTHSSYMPAEGGPGLARGYTSFALGGPEPAEPEAHDWAYGGGGIYAPAGDIAKWDIALMDGKVLSPAAYKLFTTPRHLADGRATTYGCGIEAVVNKSGDLVLRHSGGTAGFVSYSVLVPRTKSAVVALSNRDDAAPWDLVNSIVSLLNKEHRPPSLKIAGPSAQDVAKDVFAQIQSGQVDRSRLGEDFNAFLTDAKLRAASARLRPLGSPTAVDVEGAHERGGMEEVTVRLTFPTIKLEASMFRSVDGKVQQFLIHNP